MEVEKILARPRRIRARMEEQRERVERLEAFAVAKLVEERKKLLGLAASYQDALWAVNDLIERLPKEHMRQAVKLRALDELSWRKAGREMGISPRSARRWYIRAVAWLTKDNLYAPKGDNPSGACKRNYFAGKKSLAMQSSINPICA